MALLWLFYRGATETFFFFPMDQLYVSVDW